MRFSQRHGYTAIKDLIQVESVDSALRNSLWNVVQEVIWDSHRSVDHNYSAYTAASNLNQLFKAYWRDYFKIPVDRLPEYRKDAIGAIRQYYFESEWYEVYDFIEFTAGQLGKSRAKFVELCNLSLEREVAGYRLINDKLAPIVSEHELSAIEDGLACQQAGLGASTHLRRALELLSDRHSPDYRNSIKESISAVESVVQMIAGDKSSTLGGALKVISARNPMHPALNRSLNALYGYTSDSEGIRHALLDEPNLDFVDAKFMLVSCAAFVNYLAGKNREPALPREAS